MVQTSPLFRSDSDSKVDCSNACQGLNNLAGKEKQRYQRKGFGLIFATLIAVGFFTGVPHFGKLYWQPFMDLMEAKGIPYTYWFLAINIGLHNLIHIGGNLVYWVFYHFEFPFIERYKNNDNPWPWYEDPAGWRALVKKSILVLLFNSNVIPWAIYMGLDRLGLLEPHSTDPDDIQGPLQLAMTILFFMMCEDFTFYWGHRFAHLPALYPYVHKVHHTYFTTVGIAAEYAHPVEFVLGNMLPTAVGPLILGQKVHVLYIFAWYCVRFGETLDGHCGYEFSWSPYRLIPFSGSAEYHDFHHSANIGNYGSFFCIWDTVFGTNKAFNRYVRDREAVAGKTKGD